MRGGKRPGAGRPPGARNRKTLEIAEAIEASGSTPLEYMIAVMRDKNVDPQMRLEAAKGAAPYVHSRLSSAEILHADLVTAAAMETSNDELERQLMTFIENNPGLRQKLGDTLSPRTRNPLSLVNGTAVALDQVEEQEGVVSVAGDA